MPYRATLPVRSKRGAVQNISCDIDWARMVLVYDVKISQRGRKNLAVRFNLISDASRLAGRTPTGVEPNNPFNEIYRLPSGWIMLVVAMSASLIGR